MVTSFYFQHADGSETPDQFKAGQYLSFRLSKDDLGTDQAAAGESGRTNNVCQPATSIHQMVSNIITMIAITITMMNRIMRNNQTVSLLYQMVPSILVILMTVLY